MNPLLLASGDGPYQTPSVNDLFLPPFIGNSEYFTKPIALLVLAMIIIAGFFWVTARNAKTVPSKLQFAGESAYGFVRNGIARDVLGSKDFLPYVPYLFALFYFVLVNNLFGIVPFLQFPGTAKVGVPYALAILSWLVFNGVGIKKHGFFGYLKSLVPPGLPKFLLPYLYLLEFFSTVIVRPITLSLRLFANMFAGHLTLLVFITGGEYLLLHAETTWLRPTGILAWVLAIVLTFFEALIEVLQAYIFTLLSALYIAGALAEEH